MAAMTTLLIAGLAASYPAAASSGAARRAAPAAASAAPAATGQASRAVAGQPGALAATATISGTVLGPGGARMAGACVAATGPAGTWRAQTGADGLYELTGLIPGGYRVSFRGCTGGYFEQWYGGSYLESAARQLLIGPGGTALAPFELRATSPMAAKHSAARGKAPAAQDSRGVPPGFSNLSGVIRSRSGKPLAGICATAYYSTRSGGGGEGTNSDHGGRYELSIGPRGNWQVVFTGGCGNSGNYAPQWWRYSATSNKAVYLHPATGRNFHDIDARLGPGAAISGTVRVSNTGLGLAGVCVDILPVGALKAAGDAIDAMGGPAGLAVTNSAGFYRLKNLGTGRYAVQFDPTCYGQHASEYVQSARSGFVHAADGKTTTGVDGVVQLGATITGTVTAQSGGALLAGICVFLAGGSAEFYGATEVRTAGDGSYSFSGLPPGSYQVSFFGRGCGGPNPAGSYAPQFYSRQPNDSGAASLPVTYGQTLSGINAVMAPGGTVTGKVTNAAGKPLRHVCVQLEGRYLAGGYGPDIANLTVSPVLSNLVHNNFPMQFPGATTAADGSYSVRDLAPGQYSVSFYAGCARTGRNYGEEWFAPDGRNLPEYLSVAGGAVTSGVDAVLRTGGMITGVVTGQAGKPIRGICVDAYPASLSGIFVGGYVGSGAQTGPTGGFTVRGLAPGRYQVSVDPCQGKSRYAQEWFNGKAFPSDATLVMVRSGRTSDIRVPMTIGGTVSGRILTPAGTPERNACVFATDPAGDLISGGFTGPQGRYEIARLMPGRYDLQASQCGAVSPRLGAVIRQGIQVRSARAASDVTITLPAAGMVSGSVLRGASATPTPAICVYAVPRGSGAQDGFAVTGPNGAYQLTGLVPGRYRVYFTSDCAYAAGADDVAPGWFSEGSGHPATVHVRAGRVTAGISATLASDGAIAGSVTTGSAVPVPGECVGAFADDGAAIAATPAAIAISGADGSYQISDLPAGAYRVEFSSGCGAGTYAVQWWDDAARQSAGTAVQVMPGETTGDISALLSG